MSSPTVTLSLLKKKKYPTLYITVLPLMGRNYVHELDYYMTVEKINVLLVFVYKNTKSFLQLLPHEVQNCVTFCED